jgi:hypothetical protein
VPEETAPVQTHPIRDLFRKCNLTCWAHHNQYTCGTFVSEARFIFGSCRNFFGESCPASPPAVYAPGGYPGGVFGPGYDSGDCPFCH